MCGRRRRGRLLDGGARRDGGKGIEWGGNGGRRAGFGRGIEWAFGLMFGEEEGEGPRLSEGYWATDEIRLCGIGEVCGMVGGWMLRCFVVECKVDDV